MFAYPRLLGFLFSSVCLFFFFLKRHGDIATSGLGQEDSFVLENQSYITRNVRVDEGGDSPPAPPCTLETLFSDTKGGKTVLWLVLFAFEHSHLT